MSNHAMTLFDRLIAIAARSSGSTLAVIDSTVSLTYGQLLDRAGALSDELKAAGVKPKDRIGVVLDNGTAFPVAAFGVWKLGAILVPLSPQLKQAEVLKYVCDCSVVGMVTAAQNNQLVEYLRRNGAPIEHAWLHTSDCKTWAYHKMTGRNDLTMRHGLAGLRVTADWPAITQYSTGSTGHPKRVTRTHAQLLGEFLAVSSALEISETDRVLGVAPFFHSHGLMNAMALALLSGATLYTARRFIPIEVARTINRERISGLPGVPFMFRLLAELRERHDFSSVRFALSAGAPLSEDTTRLFKKVYGIQVRQLYGSTETGVISIQGRCDSCNTESVGPPITGVSVTIADDAGNPLPAGVEGNIQIASPFAAANYDNAAGNHESYFLGDHFFPGDLGRVSGSGEIVLTGRRRGFINVGGNKVDPSEIEATLLELPAVSGAIVFGLPDRTMGEKVKAVLVAPSNVTPAMVRAHCMNRLAEFKRPKLIEIRKELPTNSLGKVLRKYLLD